MRRSRVYVVVGGGGLLTALWMGTSVSLANRPADDLAPGEVESYRPMVLADRAGWRGGEQGDAVVALQNTTDAPVVARLHLRTTEAERSYRWTQELGVIEPGVAADFRVEIPDEALLYEEQRGYPAVLVVTADLGGVHVELEDATIHWPASSRSRGRALTRSQRRHQKPARALARARGWPEHAVQALREDAVLRPPVTVRPTARDIRLSRKPGDALPVASGPVDTGMEMPSFVEEAR